jgi:hypothetical protein
MIVPGCEAARGVTVGAASATGVVAGSLIATAQRCLDSPEFYKWTPIA